MLESPPPFFIKTNRVCIQLMKEGQRADEVSLKIIPQGGQVPFKLTVAGLQSAADFDLKVKAAPSDEVVRRGFKFVDFKPSVSSGNYCFSSRLQNGGAPLQTQLTVVAILYDKQGNVINFSEDTKSSPQDLVGDQTLNFEICVDSLKQGVARFDLRAWGL